MYLIFGYNSPQFLRRIDMIGPDNLTVGGTQRLQKLAHNGRGELGQAHHAVLGLVPVHQQAHQQILLVGLQHHVRDCRRRTCDSHLEKVERLAELLEGRIDTAAVVVVEEEVDCVKLVVFLADLGDVLVQKF